MNELKSFKDRLKFIDENSFSDFSIDLFHFQFENNPVYKKYVLSLDISPDSIQGPKEIPFMPISFFKYQKIKTLDWDPDFLFESSGTSSMLPSKHFIEDNNFYKYISSSIFTRFYGNPKDYIILALLPSYLERNNSSLV